MIPTAPAKTRIPEKTSPDATTSPVFGRRVLRPPPLFPPVEPGSFGDVVVPECSGLFGFSGVVVTVVLGSSVVVEVVLGSSVVVTVVVGS